MVPMLMLLSCVQRSYDDVVRVKADKEMRTDMRRTPSTPSMCCGGRQGVKCKWIGTHRACVRWMDGWPGSYIEVDCL